MQFEIDEPWLCEENVVESEYVVHQSIYIDVLLFVHHSLVSIDDLEFFLSYHSYDVGKKIAAVSPLRLDNDTGEGMSTSTTFTNEKCSNYVEHYRRWYLPMRVNR